MKIHNICKSLFRLDVLAIFSHLTQEDGVSIYLGLLSVTFWCFQCTELPCFVKFISPHFIVSDATAKMLFWSFKSWLFINNIEKYNWFLYFDFISWDIPKFSDKFCNFFLLVDIIWFLVIPLGTMFFANTVLLVSYAFFFLSLSLDRSSSSMLNKSGSSRYLSLSCFWCLEESFQSFTNKYYK